MGAHARQARPGLSTGGLGGGGRVKGRILFVAIAVVTFAIDRVLKVLVQERLAVGERVQLVEGVLQLKHVHNRGIAFGLLSGAGGLVVIGSLVVAALLFTFLLRVEPSDLLTVTGGALITGGAIGNLVDRVQLGYVVDYIDLPRFPTFNAADVWITTGVVLVLVAQLVAVRREQLEARDAAASMRGEDGT